MADTAPLDIVNAFFAANEKGDSAAIAACFGDDAVVWTPGDHWFSGEHRPEEIPDLSASILALFPDGLRFQILGITSQGERIAVEATSEGRHIDGRTYRNAYHMLFIVRDGKIRVLKEYMDTALAGSFIGHEALPSA